MKLAEVIKDIPVKGVIGNTDIDITGLTKDSRSVKEGSIFFVTKKSEPFITEALKKGARVIVAEKELKTEAPCFITVDDVQSALGKMASEFYGLPSKPVSYTHLTLPTIYSV